MIYTLDVKPQATEHFLWLVKHFDKEFKILSEDDDTVFTKAELQERENALNDYKEGNTISEKEFEKEFFSDL